MLRLKIPRLNKAELTRCCLPDLSYTSRFERRRDIKQARPGGDRQDGRWQSLLNRQISASLLSLHQMQWSTRCGAARRGVLDGERSYKVKWPRPDPRGESRPGFCLLPGSRNCTTVFIWCPLLFRVCTHLSAHAVKPRASPCSLWENCRKQTRLPARRPLVPSRGSSSSSLRPSFFLLSTPNYISVVVYRNWNKQ